MVTNAHVVRGAATVMAILHDDQRVMADVIGVDPDSDIAVLRLQEVTGKLPTVRLGNSDRLQVGQMALLLGSPLGLTFTLSTGFISRLDSFVPRGRGPRQIQLIQTIAPINVGSSGGPLLDSDGRVIGMATAVLQGAQNIGFAVPVNTVKHVLAELKEHGRIVRPWLGISGQFVTDGIKELFARPLVQGLTVVEVEQGSPAERAGLRAGSLHVTVEGQAWVLGGDIVIAIQGYPVRSQEEFFHAVKYLRVGQNLEIEFLRDGARQRVSVVLGERPLRPPQEVDFPEERRPTLVTPWTSRPLVGQVAGFIF